MKCRRCERTLLRSHGEPMCLVHGPVEVPLVSAEEALAEVSTPAGRTRQRGPFTPTPPWTQSERLLWETWKEGDPVPEEPTNDEPYRSPASAGDAGIQTLDTGKLAQLMLKSLRTLQAELGRVRERETAIRVEAAKLQGIITLCGVELPEELQAAFGKAKPKGSQGASPHATEGISGDKRRGPAPLFTCGLCGAQVAGRGGLGMHTKYKHPGTQEVA